MHAPRGKEFMHRWDQLLKSLAHDATRQSALATIMWCQVRHWPNGALVAQLARNTSALPGMAKVLDEHRVPVPAEALTLIEDLVGGGHARV